MEIKQFMLQTTVDGAFRILAFDSEGNCHEGCWSYYKGIAVIELGGKVYGAVSEYFDGTINKERVFEVKYCPTILDENEYASLKGRKTIK